jgi:hypothetical protein
MRRSFRQGICMGILGPLAFIVGLVWWIYRYTGKVPFPLNRRTAGEVTLKLVDPLEVPTYWQPWKEELAPLCAKFCALWEDLKGQIVRLGTQRDLLR